MKDIKLKEFAQALGESDKYRVLKKYQKPEYYHIDDHSPKLIGIFLDVETTGLDYTRDKIIGAPRSANELAVGSAAVEVLT